MWFQFAAIVLSPLLGKALDCEAFDKPHLGHIQAATRGDMRDVKCPSGLVFKGGQLRCLYKGEACTWRRLKHARVRVRGQHHSECVKIFEFGFPNSYHRGSPNRTQHDLIGQLVSEIRAQSRAVLEETVRSGCVEGSLYKKGELPLHSSQDAKTSTWSWGELLLLLLAVALVAAISYTVYQRYAGPKLPEESRQAVVAE